MYTRLSYFKKKSNRKSFAIAAAMILPVLSILFIFQVLPILRAIRYSFFNYNLISRQAVWTGFKNYIDAFKDQRFLRSFVTTFKYFLMRVPIQILCGFLLANLVAGRQKWTAVVRTIILIPLISSMVAIFSIWGLMMHPSNGLINSILQLFRLPPMQFLSGAKQALPSVAFLTIWKSVGLTMIFYLAGIMTIPESLYEAAYMDGVNRVQRLWYITLPMLKNTTLFLLVTITIRSFQVFGPILLTTNGGPSDATRLVMIHVYEHAFTFNNMGYASALSVIIVIVLMIFISIQFLYNRRGE